MYIWIIEGLVGPKNPNLDFTNVLAPGFAICQLCPLVTFLSTPRKVVEIVMLLRDDFMLLYPARL